MTNDEERLQQRLKEIAECRERLKERKCYECPNYMTEECIVPFSILKRLFPE